MTIRKKQNKLDQRTKIIMIIVLIFVVILAFSYINLRQKSKKIAKEQQQVESQIKKQEEKKKELKKKKEYIKTKEFIEKTATEKFGLLYPGEYLLKGSDGDKCSTPIRFAYNVKDEILAKDKRRKFRLFFPP